MAVEVGGRWSEETRGFLSALAISRAVRKRAEQAWRMRRRGMLACAITVQSHLRCWICNIPTAQTGEPPRMRNTATTVLRGWLQDCRRPDAFVLRCVALLTVSSLRGTAKTTQNRGRILTEGGRGRRSCPMVPRRHFIETRSATIPLLEG